ncbi:MAG TPA: class I SAM-dependent methyltransferase [Candidatus Lumbricidophila sp.]|nr:class I SAM-dependent methyltransferase [Candidatus Lumbricidophila sp.]
MEPNQPEIDWATARQANRENWDDRVPIHEVAYGLDAFDDPDYLTSIVRDDLATLAPFLPTGTVAGLDVCHLQCHIGSDTLSLARAGARVTGVDFSPAAIRSAARLASALGIEATWVEADVLTARAAVRGDFDLVYTSIGTITWLNDLDQWARQVYALLRPGGTFYIRDGHPVLYSTDENADGLVLRYSYFGGGQPLAWDNSTSYVGDGAIEHTRTYEWPHPLSEVLNALIRAGLQLLQIDEGTVLPWKFSPRMVEVPGGYAWPGPERDLMPVTYTIVARRA